MRAVVTTFVAIMTGSALSSTYTIQSRSPAGINLVRSNYGVSGPFLPEKKEWSRHQRDAGGTGVAIPRLLRYRAIPSSADLWTAGSLSLSARPRAPSARGSAISPRMTAA